MGPVHLNLDPMDPVYCKWNGFNQKKKKKKCSAPLKALNQKSKIVQLTSSTSPGGFKKIMKSPQNFS